MKNIYSYAKDGNLELIKKCLEKGVDINDVNRYEQTALIEATEKGYLEIVEYLVENGADIHIQDTYGRNALIYASTSGNLEIVKYLIDKGADVNVKDKQKLTAIYLCNARQCNNRDEIIQILKEAGATTDFISDISLGDIDRVRNHIENGLNVNSRDHLKRTVLIIASHYGHLEVVKYLVEQGADIEARDRYKFTALLTATDKGHLEVVKYLVEQGANVNTKDNKGSTAFDNTHSPSSHNLAPHFIYLS